ncbi:MAG: glycine cleavage system H protein [Myxococcota bacterium]
MADIPAELRYTAEHEWVRSEGDNVSIGITDHAQDQLGDVVYVDLPPVGATVEAGAPFGEIESTKSVSDLFAPLTGTITARNDVLEDRPELLNSDPYGEGWLVKITPTDATETDSLLDAAAYGDLTS